MSAGRFDIKDAEQGATWVFQAVAQEPVTDSNGDIEYDSNGDIEYQARNITGYTARMMVKEGPDFKNAIIELTTGNGRITIPTGTDGVINFLVDATTMEGVDAGEYRYDVELVNGTAVERLLEGIFIIKPEITT